MNKCFIEIRNNEPAGKGEFFTSGNVSDAFEGKVFGEYMWATKKGKKFWEVPPLMCHVILSSGEDRKCTSEDEYKTLLSSFLLNICFKRKDPRG
jgi:hypothetical protein